MTRVLSRLCLLAVFAAAMPCAAEEGTWHTDVDAAWKDARQRQRPLLVFITTSGCRYCTLMQNTTFADPEVAKIIEQGFVPAAVDAGSVAWLVRKQNVKSYPTTLIITPEAEVVDHMKGYLKPSEIKPRLARNAPPGSVASKEPEQRK